MGVVMKNSQSGGSSVKVMLFFLFLGVFIIVAGRIVPGTYNYYVLRDLADRVVGEYAALNLATVNKRVQFELHRTHIKTDDETFVIIKSDRGYRVYVDYPISMEFEIGEYNLSMEGYEYFSITYEAES
jgi:hypothetical protein